ncbi:fumarylacetoacetase [Fusarium pseudocircinatum]|uniref:Fumarylacetoacetase n=1 Tax=Fusarium pseudocircinatum TaxID=56676 RepID=A0A8H5L7E7_9HYPO|nr:fumarylacetoacetase [Fusarium pseudocircinatum]
MRATQYSLLEDHSPLNIMKSWLNLAADSEFSLLNLPYGIFSTNDLPRRDGVAVGDFVLDLTGLSSTGLLDSCGIAWLALDHTSLNDYAELEPAFHASVTMHLPFRAGDYTDFFVGVNHARNCNLVLRGSPSLHPGYTEQPMGYHGRASSITVSGTPILRPHGQMVVNSVPTSQLSKKLDFEVEFAAFIGKGNAHGEAVTVEEATKHIFGYVLLNDWSARDIQVREQFPLGPFNAKNFATTISPWVVTGAALQSCLTEPLMAMIAHHTVGGCPLRSGDLIATGTLSGAYRESLGCLLEITENGKRPVTSITGKPAGAVTWLEDGDIVQLRARLVREPHVGIGFGNTGTMPQDTISGLPTIKRVITTHNPVTGASVLLDYEQPKWESRREGSVGFNNIYTTTGFPCDINEHRDVIQHEAVINSGKLGLVNPRGSVCRIVDICPQNPEPLMHRTQSIDYGVVLQGTVELILDSGESTVLHAGDVVVQRATMHA